MIVERQVIRTASLIRLATLAWLAVVWASIGSSAAAQVPQERTISGLVLDAELHGPVAGAVVTSGVARATTDAAGQFVLRVPAGQIEVTVSAGGYFALTTVIDARADNVTGVEVTLARDARFSTTVAVVAAAPVAPAAELLQPLQVLGTPGALDNVYRTLQTLPGVAATEESGSRISVRGGSPDQNLTMMDGVEVHDPFRLFGLTSAFNPETIERFELATGGFSVKYGDRLSSLLVVANRDGRTTPGLNGSASLSLTDANVVFEGRLPGGANGSWLVTGRRTYYDVVAERVTHDDFPGFADLQARGTWAPSASTRVTLFGLRSRQAAALAIDEDDARGEFQDDTDNELAWARVDTMVGSRMDAHTIVGYSNTRSRTGVDASVRNTSERSNAPDDDSIGVTGVRFDRALGITDLSLRQEVVVGVGSHAVETGFEAHRLDTSQRFEVRGDRNPAAVNGSSVLGGAGLPDLLDSSRPGTRGGAWLQDTWHVGGRLSLQAGLRVDRAGSIDETSWSPRVSGTFSPDSSTRIVVASGRYTQSPGYEKLAQSDYVLDFTHPDVTSLRSERAWLTSARVERRVGRGFALNVEGYYKRYTNVLVGRLEPEDERRARLARYDFPAALESSVPVDPIVTTVPTNEGKGRAYGVDLLLSRRSGRLTGWTGYTWGRAEREAYGRRYPFEYDRRQAFTAVSSFQLTPRLAVAATTRLASGFPRTAPVGLRVTGHEDALDDDGDGIVDEIVPARDARGLLAYGVDYGSVGNFNGSRLPLFARVDARLTWRPRGAAGRWELYGEVINVLNRQNAGAFEAQLQHDPTSDRPRIVEKRDQSVPRLPTLGIRFRF
jgi:hypothetical protein